MSDKPFEILSATTLKCGVSKAILGRVEHAGVRFIITKYGAAVAELGPLSEAAVIFMLRGNGGSGTEAPLTPKMSKRKLRAFLDHSLEERRRRSGT